jgi:hypothetical protein
MDTNIGIKYYPPKFLLCYSNGHVTVYLSTIKMLYLCELKKEKKRRGFLVTEVSIWYELKKPMVPYFGAPNNGSINISFNWKRKTVAFSSS